jgi:hypothetical protein
LRRSPIADCRSAASAFEQSAGLPSGLLLAIGQVESGRPDPMTGRIDPWPWATNHAGEGHYFTSAPEAIAWVAAQQASGNRSIDVGCFQVNLQYHPDAFASLAEAFDPAANARYAAAFLNRLHEQSGNWPSAIALYHSADPFEGQRYSTRVMEVTRNTGGGWRSTAPRRSLDRESGRRASFGMASACGSWCPTGLWRSLWRRGRAFGRPAR